MTGATHAGIGAALGALLKDPKRAFIAGFISHAVADIIPHKDFSPKIEAGLLAASLAAIAIRYGRDSPQFWGALGAISPDFEHGLAAAGIIHLKDEVFPTHLEYGKWHGRETNERLSQLVTIITSILVAERV